jgi:hypothetical protein
MRRAVSYERGTLVPKSETPSPPPPPTGLEVESSAFWVQSLGFRVEGLGFRIWCSRGRGSRLRVEI